MPGCQGEGKRGNVTPPETPSRRVLVPGRDRRRYARFAFPDAFAALRRAKPWFLGFVTWGGRGEAKVADLNPYGMGVLTEAPIAPNEEIEFRIRLPFYAGTLAVAGGVRYVLRDGSRPEGDARKAGIRFVGYIGDSKERLKTICGSESARLFRKPDLS